MHVIIVGAGIVGACCAVSLQRQGIQVTLIDAGVPGGLQAASYGNGGWLSPASIIPMSMPGLWKKVPGYLLDSKGPLTIRWRALPALAPWLWRFMSAGATVKKVERTAQALSFLLCDAPRRHRELADSAGLGKLIEQRGLLHLYPDKVAFDADSLAWKLRRDNGVNWVVWNALEINRHVPQLARRYQLAVFVVDGAHCLNPGQYVKGLVDYAISLGMDFVTGQVSNIDHEGTVTVDGILMRAERTVIASGINSSELAKQLGDTIPMRSERGYNVEINSPGFELSIPIMPSDGKMANTSTTGGLRLSGQVEFAGIGDEPDWQRSDILLEYARNLYPQLALPETGSPVVTKWMGHRPSVADGMPVISSASTTDKVVYAFGHGHVGLVSAPKTAEIVSAIILGASLSKEVDLFSVRRFA